MDPSKTPRKRGLVSFWTFSCINSIRTSCGTLSNVSGESAIMRALTSRSQMRGLKCLPEVKFELRRRSRGTKSLPLEALSGYSYLSATMGSTRVARLDGT
jgi:hypothetical protein